MAAEILIGWSRGRPGLIASMRPRRMAAEIAEHPCPDLERRVASMRPRRMAAEISRRASPRPRRRPGFNEAAANGRGNRFRQRDPYGVPKRFNEAAANGRGNLAFLPGARPGRKSLQ